MKITDTRKNRCETTFKALHVGDVFADVDGDVNMKTVINGFHYAVLLEKGGVWCPHDGYPVVKLNEYLVIED